MMDVLIITAILALGLDHQSSAATSAAQAYARQTGVDKMLQEFQERKFSEEVRARVGQATFIAKTLTEQRITYEWRF